MCGKLIVIFCLLFGNSALTASFKDLSTEERFQTALDKQTFQSILGSIAERLKNLDHIYSIQLSQTLESKLESYHRKIDSLDAKIIRLESLTMMNLDKISENINHKNYKDDVVKTNTYRKLDFLYEGINHKLSYMDRKNEAVQGKIQEKLDLLMVKLEKMEENISQRSLDMEVELSEALQFTEDLQTTAINVENLINMTSKVMNQTSNNIGTNSDESDMNTGPIKSHNVNERLIKLEEQNQAILNVTLSAENILKEMKVKLADDFNSYANKVADMNTDFWKNSELRHQDIQYMESIVNHTRIDLKNGIRALMIQVGKKHERDSVMSDESIDSLKRDLEEVLSSQKLFVDSCYKVQSDESQIESEISETLEKLIDLFQDKIKSAMKDIKNLDKTIKSHDQRMTRIFYQANSNLISLYDKTVRGDEKLEKDIAEVKTSLGDVQKRFDFTTDDEAVKKETINQISNIINELNLRSYSWTTKKDIEEYSELTKIGFSEEISKIATLLSTNISVIDQFTKNITGIVEDLGVNITNYQTFFNNYLQAIIKKLENYSSNILTQSKSKNENKFESLIKPEYEVNGKNKTKINVKNSTQEYDNINISDDITATNEESVTEDVLMESSTTQSSTSLIISEASSNVKINCSQNFSDLTGINLCGKRSKANNDNTIEYKPIEETTTQHTNIEKPSAIKKNCTQLYSNLIDIRGDLCTETDTKNYSNNIEHGHLGELTTETSTPTTKSRDSNGKLIVESTTQPIILPTKSKEPSDIKINCTQKYSDLIDIRGDLCIETDITKNNSAHETSTAVSSNKSPQINDGIKKALLEIFGPKPKNNLESNSEAPITENFIEGEFSTILTEEYQYSMTTEDTIFEIDIRNDPDPRNNL